jgi:hypothetical protein
MSSYKYSANANSDKILVINYPPGGFGHFIHHLLSHYAEETVKIPNHLKFSPTGDAHRQLRYFTAYQNDWSNDFQFEFKTCLKTLPQDKTQIVVCDNGSDANTYNIEKYFPNARILRISVDPDTRYALLKLCAQKATLLSIPDYIKQYFPTLDDSDNFHWHMHVASWEICENWSDKWHPVCQPNFVNMSLKNFLMDPIKEFEHICNQLELTVIQPQNLIALIDQWKALHNEYFDLPRQWQKIEHALDNGHDLDLAPTDDWYMKAGIFYNICKKYHLRVPVMPIKSNALSEEIQARILQGFTNTSDILKFIELYDNL